MVEDVMSNTTMARKGSFARVVFLVANCFNVHRCQGLLLSATNPSYLDHDAKPFKSSRRAFRVSCTGTSTSVGQDDSDAAFADSVSADLMSCRCEGHLDPTNVPMLSQRTSKPPSSWMDRFQELLEFKTAHGHARVPKRYDGGLGVWVNHQRQRRHRLDEGRIVRLDAIGFCWDAAEDKVAKERQHWWERFRQLQDVYMNSSSSSSTTTTSAAHSPVEPLSPSQAEWLRRQRNEYVDFYRLRYSSSCRLDRSQIGALNELDPSWWKTAREREWDVRCQELLEYRNEHGDCCVPSTHPNRKLANWIINVRKKFKARQTPGGGGVSKLTDSQITTLGGIDPEWWKTAREREWDAHIL